LVKTKEAKANSLLLTLISDPNPLRKRRIR